MSFQEPMRRLDAAWLRMDRPANTADVVALLGLAAPLPFARLRTLVEDRLLGWRRFRQRVRDPALGRAEWEDDPRFALDRHVERVVLRGDVPTLREHLGALATAPFDPTRPPWRMQLLELGRRRAALAVKIHHCVGDGRALIRILLGLAEGSAPAPTAPGPAFRALRLTRDPAAALAHALRDPAFAARLAGEVAAFGTSLARLAFLPQDDTACLVRPLTGTRRLAWTTAVPIVDAARAAHAGGATLNELFLAAIAGGLRRVLPGGDGPSAGPEPRALVPVDARAPGDASLGNAFGLVFLDLPTSSSSPAARLSAVRERFARIRRSPDAAVTKAVLTAFGLLPRPLEHLGTAFFSRKASLVVTNVRGPTTRVELGGAEVDRMMFWVPHPATLGLGVSVLSYAGAVRVGIRADAALGIDPVALAAAISSELVALGVRAERRDRGGAPAGGEASVIEAGLIAGAARAPAAAPAPR